MRNIFLFDMDGTLTRARSEAPDYMSANLFRLKRHGRIGIVTGSDLSYVLQQCSSLWDFKGCNRSSFILLPCNGTQMYEWVDSKWVNTHSANMRDHIGEPSFNRLMRVLTRCQNLYLDITHIRKDLPLTGNFISYRKSLINWCPIGRNASDKDREIFVNFDKESEIRFRLLSALKYQIEQIDLKITCSLGGNTSIDVYPDGWDKTYALRHFNNLDCWFVGDRCTGDGNDKTIYETLLRDRRAFQTSGPSQTADLISEMIDISTGKMI